MTETARKRIRQGAGFCLRLAMLVLLTAPAAAETPGAFVGGIDDLPLMDGLAEDPGAGLVFDKPEGRIVEAWASGAVEREAVEAFYAETLPALGWAPAGALAFTREDEFLLIAITEEGGTLTVRFSLSPR